MRSTLETTLPWSAAGPVLGLVIGNVEEQRSDERWLMTTES
jgi:hypothetical protein